jgi:RNA polymerase sigma factor (sigma-70 family)
LADIPDDIIKGCIANDRQSQEELYRLISPAMYGVCLQYASDADEANDFMQEGFIKVYTKIKSFRGDGSFEGWVRRIMVNTALQFIRKKKKMFMVNEAVVEESDFEITDGQYDLDVEDLLRMVQKLPDNQRMVFNLFVIEGYNHTEIAKMTGFPENTSKSHLHRARLALKEMITRSAVLNSQKIEKNG